LPVYWGGGVMPPPRSRKIAGGSLLFEFFELQSRKVIGFGLGKLVVERDDLALCR
jgi:hypothetical protein